MFATIIFRGGSFIFTKFDIKFTIFDSQNTFFGIMHRPGCIEALPAVTELLKTPSAKRQRWSFQNSMRILQVSMTLQLYFWTKPFLSTSVCSGKGPGSALHSSMTPGSVSNSQMHLKKQILSSGQEAWLHLSTDFSHYFSSSAHCHKTQGLFLSLFHLLTTAVFGKQDRFKTAPPFFSNNFASPYKRQVYAFRIIPEIPYSATQWEKSNSASITWCRCNQKRGQWKETLNYLNPCLF